ncbi:HAD hydrolase-like protein [Streptomyces mirabilis]|uniref:HAD hydrolase-like protein n=1 Tax=Streptomyces mirabilis TaxID=68239 RepID=UPI002258E810|nr:HAD hydrolase-like protein [Streptomyces mirabilis]MCX4427057.1 HAD hydrolase-like protein [Streptomyces mirabilis]
MSILLTGAMLGAVAAGRIAEHLGRRKALDEMMGLYNAYLRRLSEEIWSAHLSRLGRRRGDLAPDRTHWRHPGRGVRRRGRRGKTGNGTVKLGRYFVFGAYGSDSPDREELTRLAVAKAARLHGRALGNSESYVVEDTPRDIEAAHAADATAFGVASGHYSAQQLRAAKADHVLGSGSTVPRPVTRPVRHHLVRWERTFAR